MANKKGFSNVGGTATLLDDETQTMSPADREFPSLTKKQIEEMHHNQVEALMKNADDLDKRAEHLANTDDEKAYNSAIRIAERTRALADLTADVKMKFTDTGCVMNLGRIKKAVHLKSPLKDAVSCLSLLVEDYSTHISMERARRSQKRGKFDYSGMGEIIRGDKEDAA